LSDPAEVLKRSKALVRAHKESAESEQLLERLPQGHGSRLNSDMVDGLHAAEIIARAPGKGGGGSGGSGYGDMTKAVYDPNDDGRVVDSDKLQGQTLAQVQDHTPKAHGNEAHSTQMATSTELTSHTGAPAPHSGHEQTANKDQANGYAGLSAATKVAASQMPTAKVRKTLTLPVSGTLEVGSDKSLRIQADCDLTLVKVRLVVKTAPTGADLIIDIHKGTGSGTTIFTTQANRPKITAGNKTGVSVAPDVTSVSEGDEFSLDIDQVGSTIAGADLTVELIGEQSVAFS
jgi:hypothetical protein